VIGVEAQDAVHASAKSGVGIEDILEQIVESAVKHHKSNLTQFP
jgi:translation elongation factor EF-4